MLPISGNNLIRLIPQKPPFVFISTLLEVSEKTCTTTFKFDAGQALCDEGIMSAAGLLENIAQTSGCKLGYEDFLKGKKHTVGFIGEVRDFEYSKLPVAGEELTTEVTVENKIFGTVTVISGKISVKGREIASCRMKVFFEPEEETG